MARLSPISGDFRCDPDVRLTGQWSWVDPLTFGTVPLVLLTAALVASYVPARRAASISPVEALKAE